MGRILAWILRMSNGFGIIEMAWLPKKLKKYWYRCNLHQWHFTANGLVHVQQIRAVSLKKNYQYVSVKMGKYLLQVGFIVGQVPLNSFSNLDVRVTFLQETAKNRPCKLFGEYDHKSK